MPASKSDERPWSRTPSPFKDPDAGLKGIDHYQRRLPQWRYRLRQQLIPIVRLETPYIARVQQTCRSALLDSYFAMTANLGTHTFFMAGLPICFWFGYPDLGIALVHMLALGVYLSGYVKDMLCLPRPLSPPLQRITMSGSAALEYGFPSTHTTNAVSVAFFCLYQLQDSRDHLSPTTYNILTAAFYCYAVSISIGRIYCGMHGFFDVVFGGFLGALIAWIRVAYGPSFDAWILNGSSTNLVISIAILAAAVRFHPEPADNCPCFDDSVAFIGVVMGIEIGLWHYSHKSAASVLGWQGAYTNEYVLKAAARIVLGIVIIFLWRAMMKPLLLRTLPPVFRFVDHWGFRLPRRYFLQARHYKSVPPLREDDNVLPQASEIPAMLSNTRKRTISVGPQSEADVREYIANREQKRRDSRTSASPAGRFLHRTQSAHLTAGSPASDIAVATPLSDAPAEDYLSPPPSLSNRASHKLEVRPPGTQDLLTPPASDGGMSGDESKEDERQDQQMFSALERPRIRYDVEVITKLIVYAGIAWLAVEGNPILFEVLGLT